MMLRIEPNIFSLPMQNTSRFEPLLFSKTCTASPDLGTGFSRRFRTSLSQAAEPAERPPLVGPAWKAPVPPCAWN